MKIKTKTLIAFTLLFCLLSISGCVCCKIPVPPLATPTPGPENVDWDNIEFLPDTDTVTKNIQDSASLLNDAESSLRSGDTHAFAGYLAGSSQDEFKNYGINNSTMIKLADGLMNAKMIEERGNMIIYEMEIDGETISFFTIRGEAGWKIGGI